MDALFAEVNAAAENGEEAVADAVVARLNRSFAHVTGVAQPFILSHIHDAIEGESCVMQACSAWLRGPMQRAVFTVQHAFERRGRGGKVEQGVRETEVNCGKLWLKHRQSRCVDNVCFAPPPMQANGALHNMYSGPGMAEGDVALAAPVLHHIKHRLCAGDEDAFKFVMGWCAHLVQQPGVKMHSALVMMGSRGAGRGLLNQFLRAIVGARYCRQPSSSHSGTGRFSTALIGSLLIFMDELTWGGSHDEEGALKKCITEEYLQVERKGVDAAPIRDLSNVIIASNSSWVVPVGELERRFMVLRVSEELSEMRARNDMSAINELVALID